MSAMRTTRWSTSASSNALGSSIFSGDSIHHCRSKANCVSDRVMLFSIKKTGDAADVSGSLIPFLLMHHMTRRNYTAAFSQGTLLY